MIRGQERIEVITRYLVYYYNTNVTFRFRHRKLRQVLMLTRSFFKDVPECDTQYMVEMKKKTIGAGNRFWIGPEHPLFSQYIAYILTSTNASSCLEVGYQCGGLTIPAALTLIKKNPNALYVGIDNEEDENAKGQRPLILEYLHERGVENQVHLFTGDANEVTEKILVNSLPGLCFDVVVIDHAKAAYPDCFELLEERKLISNESIIFFHDIYSWARNEWLYMKRRFRDYYWLGIPQIMCGLGLAMKKPGD